MTQEKIQDKCRGSLVGGAVGDALGYEVEFMSLSAIRKKYGEKGIVNYGLDRNGVAEFSDDTQMSLFTAEGLLITIVAEKYNYPDMLPYISDAYHYWYTTQTMPPIKMSKCWLTHLATLWSKRAPGMTCMSALASCGPVVNNSKGCGGVMRVAPIGIYSGAHPKLLDMVMAGQLAGMAADLTHKHPLSTLSSIALAMLVSDLITHEKVDREKFRFIVVNRVLKLMEFNGLKSEHFDFLSQLIVKALDLAEAAVSDTDAIRQLGEGWVAEETLAIAIFSVMRYIDDFEKCIVCAVNHDGDSDSTGAVAGNIIGAILGYSAIPKKYLTTLELHDILVSVADDLGGFSSEGQMTERYVNHKPFNVNPSYLL